MTAIVPVSRVPPGHYGFRQAARMEWIKLRTLRSVKWALLVALAAGELATFAGFLAAAAFVRAGVPHPSLNQPAVLRAVAMPGASLCLTGLIGLTGLGLGAIVRHGAAAIAVLFALVFAAPLFGPAQAGAGKSCPSSSTRTRWALPSRRRGHAVAVGRAEHHLRLCRGAACGRRLAAEPPGRVSGTMSLWTPSAW